MAWFIRQFCLLNPSGLTRREPESGEKMLFVALVHQPDMSIWRRSASREPGGDHLVQVAQEHVSQSRNDRGRGSSTSPAAAAPRACDHVHGAVPPDAHQRKRHSVAVPPLSRRRRSTKKACAVTNPMTVCHCFCDSREPAAARQEEQSCHVEPAPASLPQSSELPPAPCSAWSPIVHLRSRDLPSRSPARNAAADGTGVMRRR